MIEVSRKIGIYSENVIHRVRTRNGLVYWIIGDKAVEMRTPEAHRIGFALCKQAGEAEGAELIIVKLHGRELQFLPNTAKKVGAALLRKADAADDFQLQRTG